MATCEGNRLILGCFLTRRDLLVGTSGVVEDCTTRDVSLLETQVKICSATPMVVATSLVDQTVTTYGATLVGMEKETIWLFGYLASVR